MLTPTITIKLDSCRGEKSTITIKLDSKRGEKITITINIDSKFCRKMGNTSCQSAHCWLVLVGTSLAVHGECGPWPCNAWEALVGTV